MGRRAEQIVLIDIPDTGMRVDQDPHSMYSLKSIQRASKSGDHVFHPTSEATRTAGRGLGPSRFSDQAGDGLVILGDNQLVAGSEIVNEIADWPEIVE